MRCLWFLPVAIVFLPAVPVFAHSTVIEHRQTNAIEIRAMYDNGEPMTEAQVTVYAPDNPSDPWLKGITTEDGRFAFVPNPDMEGEWDVKVRKAGHGDFISVPVEGSQQAAQSGKNWQGGGYTTLQKILMAALGVWGFIGTALFFARNRFHQT